MISWDSTREIPFSKLSFEAEMSDKQTELDTKTFLSHPRERPKVTVSPIRTNLWAITMNCSWARDCLSDYHFIKNTAGPSEDEGTRVIAEPEQCKNP